MRRGRLILVICALAVLATGLFAWMVFERLPHLEDEVAFLFQAKTMALGRLAVPSPEHASAFWQPFVLDYQGQRFGKYPPGWPALLGLGVLARAAWLVNPLLAAACLYLVYRLWRELYVSGVGLLAAGLGLASPLFLVLGGSLMSHMASMAWLLLFTLWFLWADRGRSRWFAAGAGACLGAAFLTRPLTAVGYAAPFALYGLVRLVRARERRSGLLLMAAAAAVTAALLPLYQWAVTGDPWLNPYTLWWPYDRIGFGPGVGWMPGGHSPHYAWLNLKQDLSHAATNLLGWPALSWAPLLLALALRPRRGRDWALLAPFACLAIAQLFYWIGSPARVWGPRYYFEGFGLLWVLAAAGLAKAWAWGRDRGRWPRAVLAAATTALVAVNLGVLLPPRAREAHDFNGVTAAQLKSVEEAGLARGLVIVEAERWREYAAMMAGMSPLLDDAVLYASPTSAAEEAAVIAAYPDRPAYRLQGGRLTLIRP